MDNDPIVQAAHLMETVTELLQRAVATNQSYGHGRSEVRYAEALARTLLDQLNSGVHPPALVPEDAAESRWLSTGS